VSVQIGCGIPSVNPDIKVYIVDSATCKPLPYGRVGEIWIDSPSKAQGYFGLKEKSEADFHANMNIEDMETTITDSGLLNELKEDSKRKYLRTGDLGFLHDKELFICGRIKDLIIIRGRNHYPQDIEHCAELDDRLRPGCSAAFSITVNNQESLVLVAECKEETGPFEEISSNIRNRISSDHGVSLYAIVLIKPRSIYKTSSGKIARQRTKSSFLSKGELQPLYSWTSSDGGGSEEYERDLAAIEPGSWDSPEDLMKKLLEDALKFLPEDGKKKGIDPTTPLIDIGMDSMSLAQFKGLLTNKYAVTMTDEEIFSEDTTLITIQEFILKNGSSVPPTTSASPTVSKKPDGPTSQKVPETPLAHDEEIGPDGKKRKKCIVM
jgi:hypothetical protein